MKQKLFKQFFFYFLLSFLIFSYNYSKGLATANYWEADIQKFEKQDKINFPKAGSILFTGSSSIRMWKTLKEDFAFTDVINRGFGGSQISDLIYFVNRIVIPYHPRHIVVYSGDNDIASGKTSEMVFNDYHKFVKMVRDSLPDTPITYIAIKPSIARWKLSEKMLEANRLIEKFSGTDPKLNFVDIFAPMIGENGNPKSELFIKDGLHLNREGYKLWRKLVMPYIKD